ncbi:MAG TPA: hypothetical protein VE078_18045 [Thermoanaerobaculia bacterium]|nr:hypothetical protein [Thermoanaerobaculia bacterium]
MDRPQPAASDFQPELLPALLKGLRDQAKALVGAATEFQRAQAMLPVPSREEVAEMRAGKRSLTREAYLIGFCQRTLVRLEDLIDDVRLGCDDSTIGKVHELQLSAAELNAIQSAVEALGELPRDRRRGGRASV